MLTAGRLARQFHLSRTTLLYYDSIGLLRPDGRGDNLYRRYSEASVARLAQICRLRDAGLKLKEIKRVLDAPPNALTRALEQRLEELNGELAGLRNQQRFILGLLKSDRARGRIRVMSKSLWVSLLESAGFSEEDRFRWHVQFERASPERHQEFLEFLCIPDAEIADIRERARRAEANGVRTRRSSCERR